MSFRLIWTSRFSPVCNEIRTCCLAHNSQVQNRKISLFDQFFLKRRDIATRSYSPLTHHLLSSANAWIHTRCRPSCVTFILISRPTFAWLCVCCWMGQWVMSEKENGAALLINWVIFHIQCEGWVRERLGQPREENDTRKDIEVARRLSSVVVEIKKLMNGNGVTKTSDSLT